jgi:hypothetical protein
LAFIRQAVLKESWFVIGVKGDSRLDVGLYEVPEFLKAKNPPERFSVEHGECKLMRCPSLADPLYD